MFIKNKDNFIPSYLHILYETPLNNFKIDNYKNFLFSSFKLDIHGQIILEDKTSLIDVPNKFIEFMIEHERQQISEIIIKDYLKDSKHWNNIKNKKIDNTIFCIFNFNNEQEIDKFHYSVFGFDINDLKSARQDFIEEMTQKNIGGFFGNYNNLNIICANSNVVDLNIVIYHEFSHFIQSIANIRLTKNPNFNENKKLKLKIFFKIKLNEVISYFSSEEFIPHVDELASRLIKFKKKYYDDTNTGDFLDMIINFLKISNEDEFKKSEIFKKWKKLFNFNVNSICMLIASYKTKYKFQVIWNYIKLKFK